MSNFIGWLNEASLTPKDLEKPSGDGQYENRGQLFLKKLKSGEAFDMVDGSKAVLYTTEEGLQALENMTKTGDFKNFSKKVKLFRKDDDSKVAMNKIQKTKDFGSSAGVGGGAKTTDLAESAAAITAAHYMKKGFTGRKEYLKYLEKLSAENMKREFDEVSDGYNVTSDVGDVVNFLIAERSWLISSTSTAEAMSQELNPSSDVVFHRGSKTMDDIYKKARKLLKQEDIQIGNDKWNPGDLWMISKTSQRYQRVMDADTITELNGILADSIKSGDMDVVGISLKKGNTKYPPIKWYNLDQETKEINIENIKPGFFVKIPITKGVVILDTDPPTKLDIRTFQSQIDALASGELLAKKARGGKVANKVMRNYLLGNEKGVKFGKYKRQNVLNSDGDWFSSDFIDRFFRLTQELKRVDNVDKSELNRIRTRDDLEEVLRNMLEDDFDGNMYKLAANMASKAQALEFATYATDEFFEFVYSYAASSIKGVSAPFIKIGK